MRLSPLFFILFLLISFNASAKHVPVKDKKKQPKKSYKRKIDVDWETNGRFSLKLTPVSVLDPYGALIPIGAEYYFGNEYGIGFDLGLPLFYALNNNRYTPRKTINSDFKIRMDIRHYFANKGRSRYYYGGEVFFRKQDATLENSYLHFVDGNSYNFDHVNTAKNISGFGGFMGFSRKLTDRLLLEAYLGLGFRYINVSSDLQKYSVKPYMMQKFSTLSLPNEDRIGDHDLNIYIPFAIKVAYTF